jgi:hypothetical protein
VGLTLTFMCFSFQFSPLAQLNIYFDRFQV